jgi:hypothetical protein
VLPLGTLPPMRALRYQDFASIMRAGIWKFRTHIAANTVLRCDRINSNQENISCVRFAPFSFWPCRSRAWRLPAISMVHSR